MIKIFDASRIRQIDNCTIENQGISSVDLMERASLAIYDILVRKLDPGKIIYVFAGPGNNGGDVLAIARMLLLDHFHLQVFIVDPENSLSSDCYVNKKRLEHLIPLHIITDASDIPVIQPDNVVLDGLFGSGLNRPAEGIYQGVIENINKSRCKIYSIDMPSGLFVEDNSSNNSQAIIKADEVFTFQFPKLSLLLPESNMYRKKMTIVDIGLCEKCIRENPSDFFFMEKEDILLKLRERSVFSHKGDFGRALIVAGSYGKMGAAILAAKACLRTGVGLLTMHIPWCGVDVMQATVPEAMVDADDNREEVSQLGLDIEKYTLGIGPGIGVGEGTRLLLRQLFKNSNKPVVIDADALNLISQNEDLKNSIPQGSILTPHPVEYERLAGVSFSSGYDRLQSARTFACQFGVYIVLKGAYSAIVTPEMMVYFNPTGNPGMATGGSGDVLTGIITSLLAQGYTSLDAAILGVYIHGYAGDLAAKSKSQPGMLPSDIIEYIGKAYLALCK